jgi:hypothetical protein
MDRATRRHKRRVCQWVYMLSGKSVSEVARHCEVSYTFALFAVCELGPMAKRARHDRIDNY